MCRAPWKVGGLSSSVSLGSESFDAHPLLIVRSLYRYRMLVRSDSGTSRIAPWPTEWDPDMELYMTVTARMAKVLGDVLRKGEEEGDPPRLKRWNISVQRDFAIPPQLLPDGLELTPIVEFIPMEGHIGRVIFRLQGMTRTKNGDEEVEEPVAMIFDGVYDTKQDMRPTNFIW